MSLLKGILKTASKASVKNQSELQKFQKVSQNRLNQLFPDSKDFPELNKFKPEKITPDEAEVLYDFLKNKVRKFDDNALPTSSKNKLAFSDAAALDELLLIAKGKNPQKSKFFGVFLDDDTKTIKDFINKYLDDLASMDMNINKQLDLMDNLEPVSRAINNEGGLQVSLLSDEMSRMGYSNGNKVSKPDFLDLDGDGDKEEPMKEAAEDKEEMRQPKAEGGMEKLIQEENAKMRDMYEEGGEAKMLPDEKMEEQFVDFVIDEALSDKEESMLMEQLEANPELSMIFDKVVEKASEFTGAGEVDGPGTGVSDSIPARLSDGEFVFTAKAVKQLGVDNLNKMMDDAEAAFDAGEDRKAMQEGGLQNMSMDMEEDKPDNTKKVEMTYNVNKPDSVSTVNPLLAKDEEEDLISQELKKGMLGRPNMRS